MSSQTPDGTPSTPSIPSRANPFQMRFELLHLAKDILETNAHMAREDKAQDRSSFYTTEEVIETAERLKAFVSQR
jgi:hypothetical protein